MFFTDDEVSFEQAMTIYRDHVTPEKVLQAEDVEHDTRAVGPCERAQ